MPKHGKKLTDSEARRIAAPAKGYQIYWCPSVAGFGLRVGVYARAWILERRVGGKTVRRTLGAASGRGAISADAARGLLLEASSGLQRGIDPLQVKRQRIAAAKVDAVTFGQALTEYIERKRRAKDGLPLKARTRQDYLAMLEPGRQKRDGTFTHGGELHSIADAPLTKITAKTIHELHRKLEPRGERRQGYAMQVLRAVLRHHGVHIEDNPLSVETAGKDRVTIPPSRGNPQPIPAGRIGAWWRAACAVESVSADSLRFQLLTGCRPGEVAKIEARHVNIEDGRVLLPDTKNRRDHIIYLSKQAQAIIARRLEGKAPGALVFGVQDPGKTLARINAEADTPGVSPHKLRHSFASVAAALLPYATLQQALNHAATGDVSRTHYVDVGADQLRAGWQRVADHIEALR